MTATDGHRLHLCKLVMAADHPPSDTNELHNGIIPADMITLALACLDKTRTITACIYKDHAVISDGFCTLTTKTIDATYPEITRIIPAINPAEAITFTLPREAMKKTMAAMRKARAAKLQQGRGVRIDAAGIAYNPDLPIIELKNDTLGQNTIGYNAAYLDDLGNDVAMQCETPTSPALVLFPDQPRRLAILMPMHA
jgi:DNA polymerase III sliding clamp (beta) subunit (PCNA family)